MKNLLVLFALITIQSISYAQSSNPDYVTYHRGINNAEHEIFIKGDSTKGLRLFKETFDKFSFVFIDDCIEAFQLALFFKKEDYAMSFLKKAIDNGFEIKLLNMLYYDWKQRVFIHDEFILKNAKELDLYERANYPKYLKRIDRDLLVTVMTRHVREQLFKNYHPGLSLTMAHSKEEEIANQHKEYIEISRDNLRFIDSLARKGVFLGEQNLGIYTDRQAASLMLPFASVEILCANMLRCYELPQESKVPFNAERDYFELGPVYNMLFHNTKSYDILSSYKDEAIKKGYMHPREYASLKYNHGGFAKEKHLYLVPRAEMAAAIKEVNAQRESLLLPPLRGRLQ